MAKFRSRDGCATCRARHVKCDEVQPVCGQCKKRDQPCLRGQPPSIKFRDIHQRRGASTASSSTTTATGSGTFNHRFSTAYSETSLGVVNQSPSSCPFSPSNQYEQDVLRSTSGTLASPRESLLITSTDDTNTTNSWPDDYPLIPGSELFTSNSISISQLLHPASLSPESQHWIPSLTSAVPQYSSVTHQQGCLIHHYSENLGRWLDCTDASRQFTLKIPAMAKTSPTLLHAVMSVAARHMGDTEAAEQAHQACVKLLVEQLTSGTVADDDALLCAIVILRVFEQLNVMVTGLDQEQHLTGCSALIRASQPSSIDPSSPTLRQAAFWIYVKQCLYNACVNQQPPNVDRSLTLLPPPVIVESDTLSRLRAETAWANTMVWMCSTVLHFCFGTGTTDPIARLGEWKQLTEALENWKKTRPATFDPVWHGQADEGSSNPFPQYFFTADWHVMAFAYYHLACMLLTMYKPTRFAVRRMHGRLWESDAKVVEHARSICGACKNSLATVPMLITLCHAVFIWGPLMVDQRERDGVIDLLLYLQKTHSWPTAWIISSLKEEWEMP